MLVPSLQNQLSSGSHKLPGSRVQACQQWGLGKVCTLPAGPGPFPLLLQQSQLGQKLPGSCKAAGDQKQIPEAPVKALASKPSCLPLTGDG